MNSTKIISIALLASGGYVAFQNYKEDDWRENGLSQLAPDRSAGQKVAGYAVAAALILAGAMIWRRDD